MKPRNLIIPERAERIRRRLFPKRALPAAAIRLGVNAAGIPSYLTTSELDHHLHVQGGSQRGKTTMLTGLCNELLNNREATGQGFSVIDPHGELADNVLQLCALRDVDPAKVVYLTLRESARVPVINPLGVRGRADFRAECFKESILKAHGQARSLDSPGMNTTLSELGEILVRGKLSLLEGLCFVWLLRPENKLKVTAYLEDLPDSDTRSYWEYLLQLPPAEKHAALQGPANRLRGLLRPPALRRMFGTTVRALDVRAIMDKGGIAIFDTSLERAEITPDLQDLVNALILQQYHQAFQYRTAKRKAHYDPKTTPPHTLIMDEFGSYCSINFARTLVEASKFGLRCVFAHHTLKQLVQDGDERLRDAILAVPNKLIFGAIPPDDATVLAEHLFLADFDPYRIKYQPLTVTWDPIVQKVVLRSRSGSASYSVTTNEIDTTGTGATKGRAIDPETGKVIDTTTDIENAAHASGRSEVEAGQEGWNRAEAYQTFYKRRNQLGTPVYSGLDEQVFLAARHLRLNPPGVAVLGPEHRRPEVCHVKELSRNIVTDEVLRTYRARVEANHWYHDAGAIDNEIEERQLRLLEAAKPQEVLEPRKPARVTRRRKTRR